MVAYSDGKINKTDQGDIDIVAYIEKGTNSEAKGRLILDFRKDLSWLGFDKKGLRDFIDGLEAFHKKL